MIYFNKISLQYRFSVALLLACLVFVSSCKKVEQADIALDGSTQVLKIRVSGIDDAIDLVASSSRKVKEVAREDVMNKISESVNYSTSYEQASVDKSDIITGLKSSNRSASKKALKVLGVDVVYRFILFEKIGNNYTYVSYKDARQSSASEAMSLTVVNGKTYKWVAYSYNLTDSITDVTDSLSYTIPTSIDKDLLYASGEIIIPVENESLELDIRFKHRLARIGVTMNAREFPATIPGSFSDNSLSVQLAVNSQNYFKKGQLNLLEDRITNLTGQNFTSNLPFINSLNSNGDSTRVAYFYTADFENELSDITVTISRLELQDIYTYRLGDYPVLTSGNIVIRGEGIIAQPGYSYSPTVNLENTAGVELGDLIWARGNLTYNPSLDTYTINKSPYVPVVSAVNDYWMYNSLTPWDQARIDGDNEQNERNWAVEYDPCRQVVVQTSSGPRTNVWRLPTKAEVLALGGESETLASRRLQSDNWNSNNVDGKVDWVGARPAVRVPDLLYTSFKGDGRQWVTFFKTGFVNVRFNYNQDINDWILEVEDSVFIAVSDGDPGTNTNFTAMHIDGEKNYFGTNDQDLNEKVVVRCVRDANP